MLAALAMIVPAAAGAQSAADQAPISEDSLRVSVGATYAEGRYGQTARTKVATVPVSLKYNHSRFSVKVTVPYVHIHGPGTLLDGTGSDASGSGSSGSGSGVVSEIETGTSDGGAGSGTDAGGGTSTGGGQGTGTGTGTGGTAPVVPAPMRNRGRLGDASITLAYGLPLGDTFALEAVGGSNCPPLRQARASAQRKSTSRWLPIWRELSDPRRSMPALGGDSLAAQYGFQCEMAGASVRAQARRLKPTTRRGPHSAKLRRDLNQTF